MLDEKDLIVRPVELGDELVIRKWWCDFPVFPCPKNVELDIQAPDNGHIGSTRVYAIYDNATKMVIGFAGVLDEAEEVWKVQYDIGELSRRTKDNLILVGEAVKAALAKEGHRVELLDPRGKK